MVVPIAPKIHSHISNINTNSPDINLERDIIEPEIEAEVALGMQASELGSQDRFQINISTILISALLFLMILAWFDFVQTAFYVWLIPEIQTDIVPPSVKLWYALLITIIIIMLIILIYYYSREHIK